MSTASASADSGSASVESGSVSGASGSVSGSSEIIFEGYCCRLYSSGTAGCQWTNDWKNDGPCAKFTGALGGKYGCETVDCGGYVDETTPCSLLDNCEAMSTEACARWCTTCTTVPLGLCLPCTRGAIVECIEITRLDAGGCETDCECDTIAGCIYVYDEFNELYVIDEDFCTETVEDCFCPPAMGNPFPPPGPYPSPLIANCQEG